MDAQNEGMRTANKVHFNFEEQYGLTEEDSKANALNAFWVIYLTKNFTKDELLFCYIIEYSVEWFIKDVPQYQKLTQCLN